MEGDGLQQGSSVLRGHNGTIRCLRFSPEEGGLLGSAGAGDYQPRLWDYSTGQCLRALLPHGSPVHGVCWAAAGGRDVLVAGCEGGLLRGYDPRSPSPVWELGLGVGICCLASVPGGLVAGCVGGTLVRVDLAHLAVLEIGRASCRERVCQYV